MELFGRTEFPAIGDGPYSITLGPHGFYWFSLEPQTAAASTEVSRPTPEVEVMQVEQSESGGPGGDPHGHAGRGACLGPAARSGRSRYAGPGPGQVPGHARLVFGQGAADPGGRDNRRAAGFAGRRCPPGGARGAVPGERGGDVSVAAGLCHRRTGGNGAACPARERGLPATERRGARAGSIVRGDERTGILAGHAAHGAWPASLQGQPGRDHGHDHPGAATPDRRRRDGAHASH